MKHIKYLSKCLILNFIIILCIHTITLLVTPKHYGEWASTRTYDGFYSMPENTLDVLMFGSSHAVSFFSPQELYNASGLRSYNLGCEQQNLLTSYYWLREALKYQTPKVVVLETFFLFPYELGEETPVQNFHASSLHKAFDYMKPSLNKFQAVQDICSIDNSQKIGDYLFPLLQYHSRWKELSEEDFRYLTTSDKYDELKGYSFFGHVSNYEFNGYFETGASDTIEMLSTMELYLDKIVNLCTQRGIKLILVTTPTNGWTEEKHNAIAAYAKSNSIDYLDFCSTALINETNYIFSIDNADYGHGNICGATKITNYLANYISKHLNWQKEIDIQWELDNTIYIEKSEKYLENIITLLQS